MCALASSKTASGLAVNLKVGTMQPEVESIYSKNKNEMLSFLKNIPSHQTKVNQDML